MPVLGFSQKTYPAKFVIDKDTVCVIGIDQVKQLNLAYVYLGFYRALSDTFRLLNRANDSIIKKQSLLVNNFDAQLRLKQSVIDNSNEVILNYKTLDKSNNKKIGWLRLQRNVLAGAVAVAILKIFVFK